MKLQKILLAVMAVVIAVSAWTFYNTPSPILYYDASESKNNLLFFDLMKPAGKGTKPEMVDVIDSVDRGAVIEILSRYTRGRGDLEDVDGYSPTAGGMRLVLNVEEIGPLTIILGADYGDCNVVFVDSRCYEIHNADALHAELTVLLPD